MIKTLESNLLNVSQKITNFYSSIAVQNSKINKIQELKSDRTETLNVKEEVQQVLQSINIDLDKKENKLRTLEMFIDKYVNIRIQTMISDTLNAVSNRRMLNKLETYEVKKFKDLNFVVLDDNNDYSINI